MLLMTTSTTITMITLMLGMVQQPMLPYQVMTPPRSMMMISTSLMTMELKITVVMLPTMPMMAMMTKLPVMMIQQMTHPLLVRSRNQSQSHLQLPGLEDAGSFSRSTPSSRAINESKLLQDG